MLLQHKVEDTDGSFFVNEAGIIKRFIENIH